MQLPVRLTWTITSLAILPLLFPPLETADVPPEDVLVHIGCFEADVVINNNNNDEHYITNNNYVDWDIAVGTCLKDLKTYISVKTADERSRKVFKYSCGYDVFNKSTGLNTSVCEPCYPHTPPDSGRFCGGPGAMSVYKIRDDLSRDQTQLTAAHYISISQDQFLPLYISVTLLLIVVIILDVYFYKRCKNSVTRPTPLEYETHGAPEV